MQTKPPQGKIILLFLAGNIAFALAAGWLEAGAIPRVFLACSSALLFAWSIYLSAVHAAFTRVELLYEQKRAESVTQTSVILEAIARMRPETVDFIESQSIAIHSVPLVTGSIHSYILPGLYPRLEVDGVFIRKFIRESTADYIAPQRRFGENDRETYRRFVEWLKTQGMVNENAGAAGPRTLPWASRSKYAELCQRFDIEYRIMQEIAMPILDSDGYFPVDLPARQEAV